MIKKLFKTTRPSLEVDFFNLAYIEDHAIRTEWEDTWLAEYYYTGKIQAGIEMSDDGLTENLTLTFLSQEVYDEVQQLAVMNHVRSLRDAHNLKNSIVREEIIS